MTSAGREPRTDAWARPTPLDGPRWRPEEENYAAGKLAADSSGGTVGPRASIVVVDESGRSEDDARLVALTEDQRKHLDFIQSVISRLAASSAAAKGWGLTVATAAFGFSATMATPVVAGLGLVVVCFFGLLDSYYLREERLFRFLYDEARKGRVEVYSMNKDAYAQRCTQRQVVFSWSVLWGFYGPLAGVGVAALVWALLG